MYNQQNYYQPMYRPQPIPQLKGRPVSSLEEARTTTIDFDGSVFYFPDLVNKKIYTKQINLDGTLSLLVYELKDASETVPSYVTREEFESALSQIKGALSSSNVDSKTPEFKF